LERNRKKDAEQQEDAKTMTRKGRGEEVVVKSGRKGRAKKNRGTPGGEIVEGFVGRRDYFDITSTQVLPHFSLVLDDVIRHYPF